MRSYKKRYQTYGKEEEGQEGRKEEGKEVFSPPRLSAAHKNRLASRGGFC
jgi:hypothetical protein